jgi:hypothetical protein
MVSDIGALLTEYFEWSAVVRTQRSLAGRRPLRRERGSLGE